MNIDSVTIQHALPHEKLAIDRWLQAIENASSKEVIDAYADACYTLIKSIKYRTEHEYFK